MQDRSIFVRLANMASRSGSTNRWTVVTAIGVTCGVLGLLSAAFHERSQPISPSTSTHPIPSKVGPIGTAFDVHGVRVTLERIIDPATAALSYTFPRAGMRYVALVLDLANTSGTTSTDSPYDLASVVGGESTVLVPDVTRVAECPQNFQPGIFTLGPFDDQRGCITVQVPLGDQPVAVRYASPDPLGHSVQWNLGRG